MDLQTIFPGLPLISSLSTTLTTFSYKIKLRGGSRNYLPGPQFFHVILDGSRSSKCHQLLHLRHSSMHLKGSCLLNRLEAFSSLISLQRSESLLIPSFMIPSETHSLLSCLFMIDGKMDLPIHDNNDNTKDIKESPATQRSKLCTREIGPIDQATQ